MCLGAGFKLVEPGTVVWMGILVQRTDCEAFGDEPVDDVREQMVELPE